VEAFNSDIENSSTHHYRII